MSSYMQKPEQVERKWYIIDAAGKSLGRVAATAASILRGKHLPTFTPHVDCGDHVIILNAEQVVLTGNKINQKVRYYHTGWVGGIKEIHYKPVAKACALLVVTSRVFSADIRCIGYPEKRHIFGRQKAVYRLRVKVVEFFKKQPIIGW